MRSKRRIPEERLERAAVCLRALAHPLRLRIVEILDSEDLSVTDLAERLRQPQAAVSQHLNLMKAHGLLRSERHGRSVHYRLLHPQCRQVLQCIRKNLDSKGL